MSSISLVIQSGNFHAFFVMGLVIFALVIFASEKIPLATSSLLILVILILFFEIFPFYNGEQRLQARDFFSGFGHQALVAVCALMIAGHGLVVTGALEPIGRYLAKQWGARPYLTLLQTLLVGAILSAFVNNTPIVILLLPILVSVSLRTNTPASKILMPMGFATLIGGMATTIGTSTNLLVVSVAADLGLERFSMFDFVLPAVIAGGTGIAYLWLVAPRIIKVRDPRLKSTSARLFSAQLRIHSDSLVVGKTLTEVIALTNGQIDVLQILRGRDNNANEKNTGVGSNQERFSLVPLPDVVLRAEDRLMVRDTPERLKDFEQAIGANLYAGNQPVDEEHPLKDKDQQIAEVVVVPGSPLDGRTLNTVRFTDRYHLMVLALHRANVWKNRSSSKHPGDVVLQPGDVILVQGSIRRIMNLKMSRNLLVLDARVSLPRSDKSFFALMIMALIILPAALGVLPIAVTAVGGVLAMLLCGCLTWKDATRALSAPVVLIVVTSLAMGTALVKTGGADYLASYYVEITAGYSPQMIMSGLLFLMMLLTNVVSNNAAAVIGTPIAISVARQMGLPAEPFVLAVLFGANMSFITPMAYQTNLLVMNAGNYTFWDFVRIGAPLAVMMWLLLSLLLPFLYGI